MKFVSLFFLLILVNCTLIDAQIRTISNAQQKQISERELNKSFRIKTQYIAIVPTKESAFSDGKLTKVNHYEKDGKIIYTSDYEAYFDSTGTVFSYFQDGYLQSVKKIASESNQLLLTYDYDTTGKIIKLISSGSEYKEYECYYNGKGNMIKKLGYIYYPKTDDSGFVKPNYHERLLVDEYIYKYDKNNNVAEEATKINGKLINKTKYKYNKQNLKSDELNQYLGNKVKYIYFYDTSMKLTEITRINIDGSKSYFKVEYEYFE
jgi:hypothetical protein